MHWNGGWHMGGMSLWWIPTISVLILVLFFALSSARRSGSALESPEEVLKRRYANEEIDRETYKRMLEDLRK